MNRQHKLFGTITIQTRPWSVNFALVANLMLGYSVEMSHVLLSPLLLNVERVSEKCESSSKMKAQSEGFLNKRPNFLFCGDCICFSVCFGMTLFLRI